MKKSYVIDENGNEISFPVKENLVVDSNGTSLADKLSNLNTTINSVTMPEDVPDSLFYNKSENALIMYSGDTEISRTPIKTSGGTSWPPGDVSNILITEKNGELWVQWDDPDDLVVDGITISRWAGTKVVVKASSIPSDTTDGVAIYDITTRNAHSSDPLVVDSLANDVLYYVRFFPYAIDGNTNTNNSNYGSGTPKSSALYGFHIDPTDSNPSTAITYLEGAIGKTPAHMNFSTGAFDWGDWDEDEFFMPRPCMLNYDGTVAYYLDPTDYSKKADGTTASNISSSSVNGNFMMEWGRDGKKIWYKVVPDSDPTGVSIYFADNQVDEGYHCWNFYDANNNVQDHFYTPIYNGSYISSRIRSLSGQTTGVSQTIDTEISYARSNNSAGGLSGDRWFIETYGDRMLINWLLVLLGKSLDTQTVYGQGYVNSNNSSPIASGTMNTRGLFWGESGGKQGVKVFGMEHYWGNVWRRIVGVLTYNSYQYVKLTPNTADGSSGSAYSGTSESGMINTGITSNNSNLYTRWYRYNNLGYSVVYQNGQAGSDTTYYPDYGYTYGDSTRRHACAGGYWNRGLYAGAFSLDVTYGPSFASAPRGASLSFR